MFSPIIEAYTEHNKDGKDDKNVIAIFDDYTGKSIIIPKNVKKDIDTLLKKYTTGEDINRLSGTQARALHAAAIKKYKDKHKGNPNYIQYIQYMQQRENVKLQKDMTTAPSNMTTAPAAMTTRLSNDNPKMLNNKKTISSMTFNEIVNGYSKWLAIFMYKIMETVDSLEKNENTFFQDWPKYISTFIKIIQSEIMKDTNSTIFGGATFILVSAFIYFVFISS